MASKAGYYIKLINTARWRKLRAEQLAIAPYCQECDRLGYVTPATCVHHITPVESAHNEAEQAALMFNPSNLESLCYYCHKQIHQNWRGQHSTTAVKEGRRNRLNARLSELYGDSIDVT